MIPKILTIPISALLAISLVACAEQGTTVVQATASLGSEVTTTASPRPATATATTTPVPSSTPSPSPTSSPTPTSTQTPTVTATHTPTPTHTWTATPTVTPDPYATLTIAHLANRSYGGGVVEIQDTLGQNSSFTRYLINYPSETLNLYGFMNVPQGDGPFPVAIVMHGYVSPERYSTLTYTTRYADALARAGYLVIHPNYRNWPPSDSGPDLFRVSHAVDALNLIAIIREQAGQPGPLEMADAGFIGMMGHSMGGGIALRIITASNLVDAAVLYGSMSGDERQNFEKILAWSGGAEGQTELAVATEDLERIGPLFHLERISVPVSIHHGENDGTTPLEWSMGLCKRLQELEKSVECFTYPGQPHTFRDDGDDLFIQRMIDFFNQYKESPRF